MYPTIMANETVMVEPIDPGSVKLGDILLYRSNGSLIAHRVVSINMIIDTRPPMRFDSGSRSSVLSPHHSFILRGDASSTCDAPVKVDQILGKVVSIERNGCSIDPYCFTHKLGCLARRLTSRVRAILN
jgi:hypothetical protein